MTFTVSNLKKKPLYAGSKGQFN